MCCTHALCRNMCRYIFQPGGRERVRGRERERERERGGRGQGRGRGMRISMLSTNR